LVTVYSVCRICVAALLITFGNALAHSQTVPSYVPSNGLVAWWPFSGNADDISGNDFDGTLQGNTVLTTDRFGASNSAYDFDGNGDYIQTTLTKATFDGKYAMTIAAWIRMSTSTNAYGYAIVSNHSPSNAQSNLVIEGNSDPTYHRKLTFSFVPNGTILQNYTSNGETIPTEDWTHVAGVLSDGEVTFYVDGVSVSTVDASNNAISYEGTPPNYKIGLGNPTPGFSQYFIGKIDDAGMWDRALTAAEISALYESLTITTNPSGSSVAGGQQATMTVAAAVSGGASISYQWQRNDGSGFANITDGADYSGTTGTTLTIKSAKVSKKGPYRCVVSTVNATVNSDAASLTVTCPCNE
jgi:hypothetical protein